MKISSPNSKNDIMSVGANAVEQAKDILPIQSFQTYIKQSASGRDYQNAADLNTISKVSGNKKVEIKNQNVENDSFEGRNDTANADQRVKENASDKDAKQTEAAGHEVKNSSVDETHEDDNDDMAEAMAQDVFAALASFEQVAGLLSFVEVQVQELLGLDGNEMNQLLAQLDMKLTDLLSGDAQRQLFLLSAYDAEPIDLLTNEELSGLLAQFNSMIEESISTSEITATTLQSAIEQINAMENAQPDHMELQTSAVETENAGQVQENGNIRFTVDMEQTDEQGYQGEEREPADMGAMKDQVISQLNQSVGQLTEVFTSTETVTSADIVNQVVEEIKLIARQDTTSLELQLYPEHLGKVAIQVSTRNGIVTAQITAENEMAKAALEGSIQTLKETFQNQDLKVEAIEVMVATSSFSQEQFSNAHTDQDNQTSGKGNRRLHLEELEGEEELTEDEQLNVDMMRQEGRSVDYSA